MDVQDLGAVGEIVGGLAVIATLVYLARQIRQANTSTHRQMYAQAATAISEFWLNLAKDAELQALFQKMLSEPDGLGSNQLERAFLILDSYFSLMESYYLHNQEFDEKLSQERWERILVRILAAPGGRAYWLKREYAFHDSFARYVSQLVENTRNQMSEQTD